MKLSIIIVNYNVRYFLEQAIRASLKAMKDLDAELIVVDNASVDGSKEMMSEKFPSLAYHYLTENIGFSKANNIAIERSKGEYTLLLNPDTIVSEDAFENATNYLDEHPKCGGLGVHMIDGSGSFLPESKRGLPTPKAAFYKIFGLSSLFPKAKTFGSYHLGYLDKNERHEVEILSGAFMVMRKSALNEAGLLDETFFMYGEDIDLSYRLIKAGFTNVYFPDSKIVHYKGESTKKGSVNYVFVFYRAMVIFAKKHFEKGQASLFGLFIHLAIYFRAFLAIVRRVFGRIWQLLIDAGIAYLAFLGTTNWYAEFASKDFDLPFVSVSLIGYAAIISISLLYSGVYDRYFKSNRLIKGWVIAILILLGTYALLPEAYRFSRAVILIGSALALAGGFLWRTAASLVSINLFSFSSKRWSERILVVGDANSLKDARSFLSAHALQPQFIAGIYFEEARVYPFGYISDLNKLTEAIEDFRAEEVIFDTRRVSNSKIIELMEKNGDKRVAFKNITGDPIYLIGSQEVLAETATLKVGELKDLNVQAIQRIKRTLDWFLLPILIILSPVLIFFMDERSGFIKNLWQLATGERTLVGLDQRGFHPLLPSMVPGIIHINFDIILPDEARNQAMQDNVNYLKGFSMWTDLRLLWRHLYGLGNQATQERR